MEIKKYSKADEALLFDMLVDEGDQYKIIRWPQKFALHWALRAGWMVFREACAFPITPFKVNETWIDMLTITHYSHEPDFAPYGHTLITCSINQFYSDYDAWHALFQDPGAYRREKLRIGQEVVMSIETRFPHMKGKLKLLDVATPKTFERYCNAYRGAFMSFLPTIDGKMMAHTGRSKGLQNIFLSGQWLQPPGGLPVALITGKDTIMRLCKMRKQPFIY
ncbi:MAG: hypothetical protein PHO01_10635 [Desulfotomaculaceae bacterium]|nr:hypothetical protein [Desulfotomaculaceae bacterium]